VKREVKVVVVVVLILVGLFLCAGPPLTEKHRAYQLAEDAERMSGSNYFSGYYDDEATHIQYFPGPPAVHNFLVRF
jgi:hypothetical protein